MKLISNMLFITIIFKLPITCYRYVLDGFPQNCKQVAMLRDAGVIPSRIIHLQASLDECIKRAKLDVDSRPEDSEPLHERWYTVIYNKKLKNFFYITTLVRTTSVRITSYKWIKLSTVFVKNSFYTILLFYISHTEKIYIGHARFCIVTLSTLINVFNTNFSCFTKKIVSIFCLNHTFFSLLLCQL